MTCEQCDGEYRWTGEESETLVGYMQDGAHFHNDNCLIRLYKCTKDPKHWRAFSIRRTCPACDWKGRDSCWCHTPSQKVDQWPEGEEP